jgi:hypothetical protein
VGLDGREGSGQLGDPVTGVRQAQSEVVLDLVLLWVLSASSTSTDLNMAKSVPAASESTAAIDPGRRIQFERGRSVESKRPHHIDGSSNGFACALESSTSGLPTRSQYPRLSVGVNTYVPVRCFTDHL